MKKLKYVKLFESFLNEELSPELKKRTYDAMLKIANDENNIDSAKRKDQARNVLRSISPAVENLKKQLEECVEKITSDSGYHVRLYDYGLEDKKSYPSFFKSVAYLDEGSNGFVNLEITHTFKTAAKANPIEINICKDKYQKANTSDVGFALYRDRTFVNILKKLIVQIQKDEIPGDEIVPSEPKSVTPEGDIEVVTFPLEGRE